MAPFHLLAVSLPLCQMTASLHHPRHQWSLLIWSMREQGSRFKMGPSWPTLLSSLEPCSQTLRWKNSELFICRRFVGCPTRKCQLWGKWYVLCRQQHTRIQHCCWQLCTTFLECSFRVYKSHGCVAQLFLTGSKKVWIHCHWNEFFNHFCV